MLTSSQNLWIFKDCPCGEKSLLLAPDSVFPNALPDFGIPKLKYCYKLKAWQPSSAVCTWKLSYSFLLSHLMNGNSPLWNSLQEQKNSCRGSGTTLLGGCCLLWASYTALCLRIESRLAEGMTEGLQVTHCHNWSARMNGCEDTS